ncbi:MAG: hypothetical protein WC584_02560 [Candidatus Pacearchaeota archaeon]
MKLRLPKLDYYSILKHLTQVVDVLFCSLLLFNYLNFLPLFWKENLTYVFFFVVAINTIFLAFKINKIPEDNRKGSSMIYYFSHFFLLSLIIIALNQFLKRQIIIELMPEITALSIAFGFLTFYAYRNKVEKEIEDEKISEENAEKKRCGEFGGKFRLISKLNINYGVGKSFRERKWLKGIFRILISPLVWLARLPYSFVKWMYGEGWWYSVGLIGIVVLGFVLRVWNVGNIDLVNDEYRHLNAMKHFYTGGFFEQPRSIVTTYLLIAIKYFVSYENYFAFKLPFVILGTISIILIYFLSKYYIKNKKIALFSSYLFATLPLAIGLARYIREYEIILFLMLISLILIKKFNSIIITGMVLSFWFFFYNIIGSTSIMILGIIFIIFFLGFIRSYILLSNRWKILKDYRINLIFIALIIILTYIVLSNYSGSIHSINKGFLFLFNFPAVPHQFDANPIGYTWFTQIIPFGIIFVLISFFINQFFLNKNIKSIFNSIELFVIFLGSIIYFLFIGNFQFVWQGRYMYYLFPFYIIILSISFFFFYKLIRKNIKKILSIIFIILFFLFLFSPYNAINDLIKEKSGESNPFHGQPVYPERELCSFLIKNNISPDQIVIARSWSLDYCLNADFLNDSEKYQYIYFLDDESYEYYDRTRIFTLVPYTDPKLIIMKDRIRDKNITFLILSEDSFSNKDYSAFLSQINEFNFKLVDEIPNRDVRFRYSIYKITSKYF